MTTAKYQVEYTDTFGGEANYSWVRRATLELPSDVSDLKLAREAKASIGLTGVPCRRVEMGETIALYPKGSCTVLFITPNY